MFGILGFIKNIILLTGFFIFLSYPVNDKPIFSYIYDITSPITKPMYKKSNQFVSNGFHKTKKLLKELFLNSEPKLSVQEFTDSVNQRFSSHNKKQKKDLSIERSYDDISYKDRMEAKKLFK